MKRARATHAGKGTKRYMLVPDLHFPHVDPVWEAVFLKAVEVIAPDEIIFGGDAIDAEAVSSHPKSTFMEMDETVPVFEEYELFGRFMTRAYKAAGGCGMSFIEGNHEYRILRMCLQMSGRFGRDVYRVLNPQKNITERCPAKMRWVSYAQNQVNILRLTEDLVACHGWSHAKRAASVHLEKARGLSIWFNHTHRRQIETQTALDGRLIEGWSVGSGCKKQPYWQHGKPNDWVLGFGVLYVGRKTWTALSHVINPTPRGGGIVVLDGGKEIAV